MRNKKILLVDDNYNDIIALQDALCKVHSTHSLHVVHNVRDAMQVLMGSSSMYSLSSQSNIGKVRPDILLLNIRFLQESAFEFLDVIRKYYSLRGIRVFITGEEDQQLDPELAEKYGIAGYLCKPYDLSDMLNESVASLRKELSRPGQALFSVSLLALFNQPTKLFEFFKIKSSLAGLSGAVVTKVTAGAAATVLAATMLSSSDAAATRGAEHSVYAHEETVVAKVPAPVETCTEQEAMIAAESVELPPKENKIVRPVPAAQPRKSTSRTLPPPEQEVVTESPPVREFRIVALEDPE